MLPARPKSQNEMNTAAAGIAWGLHTSLWAIKLASAVLRAYRGPMMATNEAS
jgi:hypothetical protein